MDKNSTEQCSLCKAKSVLFWESYLSCPTCKAIFRKQQNKPTLKQERARYETHNNDVSDKRYQQFVSPITSHILAHFSPEAKGLDFGAGTGPVISYLLQQKGYQIQPYDPFFHPFPELLETKYDFIICCEVIEHFHTPFQEFSLLRNLLTDKGQLICMTKLYDDSINFSKWHYKNDETHVFFYHENTIRWIQEHFSFSDYQINNRLIVWRV